MVGGGTGLTLSSSDSTALRAERRGTGTNAQSVYGVSWSTSGRGAFGEAEATTGVTYGVYGQSHSNVGRGVQGSAHTGDTDGVYGSVASAAGRGVYGYASATRGTNYGVYGVSESSDGRGVLGQVNSATGATFGVYGFTKSTSGRGVYGYSAATTGDTQGVWGRAAYPRVWADKFTSSYGNGVYISAPAKKTGLTVAKGTKNAVVPTADGARLLYAEEATEVWFSDYGSGRTVDGEAVVPIDPIFAQTVNLAEPYMVFLQANGDAAVYVTEMHPYEFVVRSSEGDPNASFSYRLVARRLEHERYRLERAPWADDDPNLPLQVH